MTIIKWLVAAITLSVVVLIALSVAVFNPQVQYIFLKETLTEIDMIRVGFWDACLSRRNVSANANEWKQIFCAPLDQFNARYVRFKKSAFIETSGRFELPSNCKAGQVTHCVDPRIESNRRMLPHCDAALAPYVEGAVFLNDTMYGAVHLHYFCAKGYVAEARYESDVFCTCNGTNNCIWSKSPTCNPDDKCLPNGDVHSDICTVGNSSFLFDEAIAIANPSAGIISSNITLPPSGHYIFPKMRFTCAGNLRQWDVVATTTGSLYVDIWRFANNTYKNYTDELVLISSFKLVIAKIGLQGLLAGDHGNGQIHRGDFIGIHYNSNEKPAKILLQPSAVRRPCGDFRAVRMFGYQGLCSVLQLENMSTSVGDQLNTSLFVASHITSAEGEYIPADSVEYPSLIGYINLGGMAPTKPKVLQALAIISLIVTLVTIVDSVVLYVHIHKYRFSGAENDEQITEINKSFIRISNLFWIAVVCGLLGGVSSINNFALFFYSYNCNRTEWHIGISGWLLLATGIVGVVAIVFLCVVEKLFLDSHGPCFPSSAFPVIAKPKMNSAKPFRANRFNSLGDQENENQANLGRRYSLINFSNNSRIIEPLENLKRIDNRTSIIDARKQLLEPRKNKTRGKETYQNN